MITEFNCPLCHVKIPTEYMAKKTEMLEIRGVKMLACIGCNQKWYDFLQYEEELLATEGMAEQLGIDPKVWMAIRKERAELQKDDERLIDDEVDAFDVKKANRLFREKWDKMGRLKPIEVMQRSFLRGVEKERQRIIQVKGGIYG